MAGPRLLGCCALALLALSALLSPAGAQDAAFCNRVVDNLFTCPDIPTVDTVDLEQYTGRWYEIGVNAVFAFAIFGQQGGQCVTANYTALGVVNGSNTIKVVNRALQTTTPIRQAQTLGISFSSQAVGLGVKFLCQFLVGTQPLSTLLPLLPSKVLPALEALKQVKAQVAAAAGPELAALSPQDAAAIGRRVRAAKPLQTLARSGAAKSPAVADAIQAAQSAILKGAPLTMSSGASESRGVKNKSPLDTLIQTLQGFLSSIPPFARTTPFSVTGLTTLIINATQASEALDGFTKDRILKESATILATVNAASISASSIFDSLVGIQTSNLVLNGRGLPDPPLPTEETASTIQKLAGKILTVDGTLDFDRNKILASAKTIQFLAGTKAPEVAQAAQALGLLVGSPGPVEVAIKETAFTAQLISITASFIRPEPVQNRTVLATGQAVQNASQPGALTVSFSQLSPPPTSNNYKIIKLDGEAANGYDLALVYSCDSSFTSAGLPQQSLFVLARTPTIPPAVFSEALTFAAKQGVYLAGDNTFLTINQNAELCQSSWAAS